MASPRRTVALSMAMVAMVQAIQAAVYTVCDSVGWTTIGPPDYAKWSASKTFRVGDVLVFSYNPEIHNVLQVTATKYGACDAAGPIATYTSSNDSITITAPGHLFFLCGIPCHYEEGQKVDINVADVAIAP